MEGSSYLLKVHLLMGMITFFQMLLPLFSQLDFPQEGSGEAVETPELATW